MAKKTSKSEVASRIQELIAIRLDGAQFHDVKQFASEKGWNVSERQLWEYLRRVDKELHEARRKENRFRLTRHLAKRHALYARAINAADFRTALAILNDTAKLEGLYPEKEARELLKLAIEQGKKIEELEARLGKQAPPDAGEEQTEAGQAGGGRATRG